MKQQDILKASGDRTVCNKYFKKQTKKRPETIDWRYSSITGTSIHEDNPKKCTFNFLGVFCMGKLLSALITSPQNLSTLKPK